MTSPYAVPNPEDEWAADDRAWDDDPDSAWEDNEPAGWPGSPPAHSPLAFADEHMRALAFELEFGPEDLELNAMGELSPVQIAWLERDLRWFYWPMILAAAAITFIIGATSALAGSLALGPLLVLMVLTLIPAALLKFERERLPEREVQFTSLRLGTLSLMARRWGFSNKKPIPFTNDVRLPAAGNKPIYTPKRLYRVLHANQTYLLYYVPMRTRGGFRLLSIEPVETPAAPPRKAKPKPKRR